MNLIFLGAAHEVTGSCTLLTACGKNILIDCGMEQGPDTYKNRDIPVSPADIDCIFLTHAHIDHPASCRTLRQTDTKGRFTQPRPQRSSAELCLRILRTYSSLKHNGATEGQNARAKRDMFRSTP